MIKMELCTMNEKCNCKVCKELRSYPRMKRDELIDIIHNQSFDLQFTKLYEETLYDAIKYLTPEIWEKSTSSLDAIEEFNKYLNKYRMMKELES